MFSTPQGRKKLLLSAKHDRLAIVSMHRDHTYTTWDDIKEELSSSIRSLAPNGLKDTQVRGVCLLVFSSRVYCFLSIFYRPTDTIFIAWL